MIAGIGAGALAMCAYSRQPWSRRWEVIRELSGGGQADTFVVRHRESALLGALKRLRRQDDPERRRRMHREVTALQTLEHPGIPKLLDSNSSEFDSESVLYLIMEYIEGPTLAEVVGNGTLSLTDAQRLLLGLLEILEYTHRRGIVHRDIKADNVILGDGRAEKPVLIDFGLSFNKEEELSSPLTHSGQQLGNRFLVLPELQLTSSLQRDPRSDLTQCVGVLFYAVTGVVPVALMDESSRLPHQRGTVQPLWEAVPEPMRQRLLRVFDRGFMVTIDQRWQSAEELSAAISMVTVEGPDEQVIGDLGFSEIRGLVTSANGYRLRELVKRHSDTLMALVRETASGVGEQLGPGFASTSSGWEVNWQTLYFESPCGLLHTFEDLRFVPTFKGQVTGNEVVLFSSSSGEYEEFARFPIDGEPDTDLIRQRLESYYRRGIAERARAVG